MPGVLRTELSPSVPADIVKGSDGAVFVPQDNDLGVDFPSENERLPALSTLTICRHKASLD